MPETYDYDLWREAEQEDSLSDSELYLESSESSEIITLPVEHVPHVQEADRTFLRERLLLAAYRLDMENMLRWVEAVQATQQDGGALGSVTIQYTVIQFRPRIQTQLRIQIRPQILYRLGIQTLHRLQTFRTPRTFRTHRLSIKYIIVGSVIFVYYYLLSFVYHLFICK